MKDHKMYLACLFNQIYNILTATTNAAIALFILDQSRIFCQRSSGCRVMLGSAIYATISGCDCLENYILTTFKTHKFSVYFPAHWIIAVLTHVKTPSLRSELYEFWYKRMRGVIDLLVADATQVGVQIFSGLLYWRISWFDIDSVFWCHVF